MYVIGKHPCMLLIIVGDLKINLTPPISLCNIDKSTFIHQYWLKNAIQQKCKHKCTWQQKCKNLPHQN